MRLAGPPVRFAAYERRLVPSLGLLFFAADDGTHGTELWRTDGTPGGTYLLSDLRPGPLGSSPTEMISFKGRLFFVADDGQRGPGLWTSDGTPQGTRLVRNPVPGSAAHAAPASLWVAGNYLYFVAPTPARGVELWRSDGTTRGTVPLTDLVPGAGSPVFWDFTVFGNRLLFVADDGKSGQELWATDGTSAGTKQLTQFVEPQAFFGSTYFLFLPHAPVGNRFVFGAIDGVHGAELWTTDGTPAGTSLLKDICQGPCSGAGYVSAIFGGHAIFQAGTLARGLEPWITDGTSGGTHLLRDLCRGSCSSYPYAFSSAGSSAFFATDGAGSSQLWHTDGTAAGTLPVAAVRSLGIPGSNGGFRGTPLGSSLVFAANDGIHGDELWRSDGTPQGTALLADLNTRNLGGSYPSALNALGSQILFLANDGIHGGGLWKSDGTEAGTSFIRQLAPGPGSLDNGGQNFFADQAAGKLFFILSDGQRRDLWRSDGTDAGTLQLTPGPAHVAGYSTVRAAGNVVFFEGTDDDHGAELWKSDGTPEGTVLVKDIEPGVNGSDLRDLTAVQNRVYFTAQTSAAGRELWVSDGTDAGTHIVKDILPDFNSSNPTLLTVHGGRLWFFASADDDQASRKLWSTDGTEAGTLLAADFTPGASFFEGDAVWAGTHLFVSGGTSDASGLWATDGTTAGSQRISPVLFESGKHDLAALGETLFFSGFDSSHQETLWISDGTSAGTRPLLDRNGNPIDRPASFRVFDGLMFFSAQDGGLWQSDGTPQGTFNLRHLSPPGNSGPVQLVPAGSHLFFPAFDRDTGTELLGDRRPVETRGGDLQVPARFPPAFPQTPPGDTLSPWSDRFGAPKEPSR